MILVTAGLNGWGASILWVAQGKYMSECATDFNKGMFNSVFWIFNMGSLVIGNLMAYFVLEYVNESTLYYILTAINGLAVLWFICLPMPIE